MRFTLCAVAVVLVGCSAGTSDDGLVITGSATLAGASDITGPWDDCRGSGDHDDFGPGMSVTIRDVDDTTIGAGRTRAFKVGDQGDAGALVDAAASGDTVGSTPAESLPPMEVAAADAEINDGRSCTVGFDVKVTDADSFSIEIGNRGERTYTRAELVDQNWHVDVTID